MGQFVKVGTVADFEDVEGGKLVDAGGQSLAVFMVGTNYCAIDNTCTHRGGPLAEGTLVGEEVICPWHGAPFQRQDGRCLRSPGAGRSEEFCGPREWK